MADVIRSSMMQLLLQAPVILVYVVGVVLALVFRSRAPKAYTVLLIGLLGLLALDVIHPFVFTYVTHTVMASDADHAVIGRIHAVVGVSLRFLYAVGLGLLIAATFLQRKAVPPTKS